MNRRSITAGVALTGLALALGFTLWHPRTAHQAAPTNQFQVNNAWAAAPNSQVTSPQIPPANQAGGGPSLQEMPSGGDRAIAPGPQPHAVTMQDGTVIWAAERERDGSTPAREH